MPDPSAPPQPEKPPRKRARRFWLFAPYVALLVAVLAWTAVWWVEKLRVEHELTKRAAELEKQGYTARWSALKIGGWPFRLHVTLTEPKAGDNAGWMVQAPSIEIVALAYSPSTWGFSAPDGLTLLRPGKGALNVSGKAIRASIGGMGSDQPRFSFQGDAVTLSPAQGAQPAAFSSIAKLEAHLQPGPDDQAALLLRLNGAQLRPEAGLARIAGGKPLNLAWDSRLTKLSALKGSNWPGAVQSWRYAGGMMTVADASLGLGGVSLKGQGGPLTVDTDGRLSGQLPLRLDAAGQNQALLGALGLLGPVQLSFKGGRAAIGPIEVGAALKIG